MTPKKSLIFPVLILLIFTFFQSFKSNTYNYHSESYESINSGGRATANNDGNTGAPLESGTVCATCHNSGVFGTSISISVKDNVGTDVDFYVPGDTYSIVFTVNESSGSPAGYGFQSTSLNSSNVDAGTFQNPSANTTIATVTKYGGRTYVEHNGGVSSANEFTVDWVAPVLGSGDITLYYVGNAVNGTGSTGGDDGTSGDTFVMSESALSVEDMSFKSQLNLYPNPNEGNNVTIELGDIYEAVDLEIVNLLGQTILKKTENNTNQLVLSLDSKPGLYFAKVTTDKGSRATIRFSLE